MSDNDDTVEPVKVTATIPGRLADALADVHDDKASRRSDTLGNRGFSTDGVRDTDTSAGDKIVRLAVDGHRTKRDVRDALRDLRSLDSEE